MFLLNSSECINHFKTTFLYVPLCLVMVIARTKMTFTSLQFLVKKMVHNYFLKYNNQCLSFYVKKI